MEFYTFSDGLAILRGAPTSVTNAYDQLVQSAVDAERLGFDGILVGEHHFEYNRWITSPIQALAAAAAATSKIKLVTAATLIPLYDPIRAAEMACTLDVLCGGRLMLGLGQGYRHMEFDGFDLEKKTRGARHTEAMEVIRLATGRERFSYNGKHYQYENLEVRPRSIQRPIDMWFCAGTSPAGAKRAGKSGFDYFIANCPVSRAEELIGIYHAEARANGYSPDKLRVSVFMDMVVGETVKEAKAARQAFLDLFYYEHIFSFGYQSDDGGTPLYNPPLDHPSYVKFVDNIFCGTTEMVIEQLKRFERLGVHGVVVWPIEKEATSKHILPIFRRK